VLLDARGCLGALGVLLGAPGVLLHVRGLPGVLVTLGVPLGDPGDPYKLRRVETGEMLQCHTEAVYAYYIE
jgi:hypothetical protein